MFNKKVFRGKSIETGEWLYGSLIVMDKEVFISVKENGGWAFIAVDPLTVHQKIMRRVDANGKPLFEGDIIQFMERHMYYVRDKYPYEFQRALMLDEDSIIVDEGGQHFPQDCFEYEKLGNVVDNPELLDESTLRWYRNYGHQDDWWK